eukprot:scaffold3820_cov415-Prasinococcus_capsulatus_cf.AAC.4
MQIQCGRSDSTGFSSLTHGYRHFVTFRLRLRAGWDSAFLRVIPAAWQSTKITFQVMYRNKWMGKTTVGRSEFELQKCYDSPDHKVYEVMDLGRGKGTLEVGIDPRSVIDEAYHSVRGTSLAVQAEIQCVRAHGRRTTDQDLVCDSDYSMES